MSGLFLVQSIERAGIRGDLLLESSGCRVGDPASMCLVVPIGSFVVVVAFMGFAFCLVRCCLAAAMESSLLIVTLITARPGRRVGSFVSGVLMLFVYAGVLWVVSKYQTRKLLRVVFSGY